MEMIQINWHCILFKCDHIDDMKHLHRTEKPVSYLFEDSVYCFLFGFYLVTMMSKL